MPRYSLKDLRAVKASLGERYMRAEVVQPRFRAFAAVASDPPSNVLGVGVGAKITAGEVTSTQCVRFYVEQKVPRSSLTTREMLPSQVDGIPTDIIPTGRFVPLASTADNNKKRQRPARPGCSIGFQFPPPKDQWKMAGTFGALVEREGRTFLLSNNHVLAENGAIRVGAPIMQPGLLDGGDVSADQVARLFQFVPIIRADGNAADCALAEVADLDSVSGALMPRVGRLASPKPIVALVGMDVEKTGRTTGYTQGSVFDIDADVKIPFEDAAGEFDAIFSGQILIVGASGSFSDRGDSGSLIVDRSTKRATGLLFAGSATHTIANHIASVLAALGVKLKV